MTQPGNDMEVISSHGDVTYSTNVISVIAGLAATEVDGVSGMSGNFGDGIAELIGIKNLGKGVKVEIGTEEVAVDLYVVLKYGVLIPEVCKKVQIEVKKAIETMTGLRCVEVNVTAAGIAFESEQDFDARVK